MKQAVADAKAAKGEKGEPKKADPKGESKAEDAGEMKCPECGHVMKAGGK